MSNLDKVNEALMKDPETAKKLFDETKRLADSKKDADLKVILAEAVKTVLNLDLTQEELDAMLTDERKLDLDELDAVAGGFDAGSIFKSVTRWITDIKTCINPPPPSVFDS